MPYNRVRILNGDVEVDNRDLRLTSLKRTAGELKISARQRERLPNLTERPFCKPLSYMKTTTLTIRLDEDLDKLFTKAARQSGKNRSEVAREGLRRQFRISRFEALRRRIMPFAEARGYLSDEDVVRDVS